MVIVEDWPVFRTIMINRNDNCAVCALCVNTAYLAVDDNACIVSFVVSFVSKIFFVVSIEDIF